MRKSTLPEHPNLLFLIIIFDLLALAAIFGLYSSNWVGDAGQRISLSQKPASALKIAERHVIVKVFAHAHRNCMVGNKLVPFEELPAEFIRLKNDHQIEEILLMVDGDARIERGRQVISFINSAGLDCVLVSESKLITE